MTSSDPYAINAAFYDRIYSFKDYAREADRIAALLAGEGVPDGARLLDAACGTGAHLAWLAKRYRASGFDRSDGMLAVARAKLPGVPLFQADMTDFDVPEPFDALVCLFSSIGHVRPIERVRAAARAFSRALVPGGALIVEPWITREVCEEGKPAMHTYEDADLKLCRQAVMVVEGDLTILEMHWLVARRGGTVEHRVERHELTLYPREAMLAAFADAGFRVRFEPEGLMPQRGLIVGRRQD